MTFDDTSLRHPAIRFCDRDESNAPKRSALGGRIGFRTRPAGATRTPPQQARRIPPRGFGHGRARCFGGRRIGRRRGRCVARCGAGQFHHLSGDLILLVLGAQAFQFQADQLTCLVASWAPTSPPAPGTRKLPTAAPTPGRAFLIAPFTKPPTCRPRGDLITLPPRAPPS